VIDGMEYDKDPKQGYRKPSEMGPFNETNVAVVPGAGPTPLPKEKPVINPMDIAILMAEIPTSGAKDKPIKKLDDLCA